MSLHSVAPRCFASSVWAFVRVSLSSAQPRQFLPCPLGLYARVLSQLILRSPRQSMGAMNGFISGWSAQWGGSNDEIRSLIQDCRNAAIDRMLDEAEERGGL